MAQLEAKIHAESLESDEEAKVGEKADGGALAKDGGDGLKVRLFWLYPENRCAGHQPRRRRFPLL